MILFGPLRFWRVASELMRLRLKRGNEDSWTKARLEKVGKCLTWLTVGDSDAFRYEVWSQRGMPKRVPDLRGAVEAMLELLSH